MLRFASAAIALLSLSVGIAHGQTTAGAGTVIVLPLATYIQGAYTTTVFVRNPSLSTAITLNVRYYQSDSATPTGNGTPLSCGQLTIGPNLALTFDLGTQCTFSSVVDNFGQIVLEDAATPKVNTFFAYSRTELVNGNGFSVEGFPIGNFSAAPAESLGLKKTSLAPHYRSNCFVGALGEPVDYQIQLFHGETGAPVALAPADPRLSGTLLAYHSVRVLDVFQNVTVANPSNVRAKFANADNSAMIGFCTLETSDNGSADFRIAKSTDALDVRQSRLACYGMDSCGSASPSATNPAQIINPALKNIHYTIFDQPDFITCNLVADAPTLAALEIKLRGPGGDPLNAPLFPTTGTGPGQDSFTVFTGEKSTVSAGATTRWFIDVERQTGSSATGTLNYGITCRSGNGITVPWLGTTATADPL